MKRIRPLAALALLASAGLLAACGSNPQPQQPPPRPTLPAVTPTPPVTKAPLSGNWEDWPRTPGDWVYRQDERGSIALYGPLNGEAVFAIRCDLPLRRIFITRAGQFPTGESGRMTIRASNGLQTYTVLNTGGGMPLVGAELAPTDPHLDVMIYSRGRILVSVKGTPDLVLPTWAEIPRVVEDCR